MIATTFDALVLDLVLHHLQSDSMLTENKDEVVVFEDGEIPRTELRTFTAGSCSDVWKGDMYGLPVAVKVYRGLPYIQSIQQQFQKLFMREISVWMKLNHPNIVPFYGVVNDYGNLPGVVLPLYKSNMNTYLKDNPDASRVKLLLDIAHGLHYLHTLREPVFHGEMKASNIMIDDDGRALISDIGQATLVSEMVFTRANSCGSCRWMAPELMIPEPDFEIYRDKSDIYGFAMLMLETLTGRQPFNYIRPDAKVIFDVIEGIRPKRPSPKEAPQLTDELWQLMTECWNPDQSSRPSAGQILNRLYVIHARQEGLTVSFEEEILPSARL